MDIDDIKRGEEAKRIIEHPLFIDAFDSVRNALVDGLARSGLGDEQTHHNLAIAIQLLEQIKRTFVTHIETGEMEAIQANENTVQKIRRAAGF